MISFAGGAPAAAGAFPFIAAASGMDWESSLMWPLRIDALVKIDPQHASKECDRRREWQEQYGGPKDDFRNRPPSQKPQQQGDRRHDQNSQAVTEVHGTQKIARFPLKLEVTDGAALLENASQRRRLGGGLHPKLLPRGQTK